MAWDVFEALQMNALKVMSISCDGLLPTKSFLEQEDIPNTPHLELHTKPPIPLTQLGISTTFVMSLTF